MLYESIQNGHNDIVLAFFILLAILLLTRQKAFWAAVAFGMAILLKYVPVVALPAFTTFLVAPHDSRTNLLDRLKPAVKFLLAVTGVTAAVMVLCWNHGTLIAGVRNQAQVWETSSLNPLAYVILHLGMRWTQADPFTIIKVAVRPASTLLLIAAMIFLAIRLPRRSGTASQLIRHVAVCLLVYLYCFSIWLMPWYALWILPLLVLSDDTFGYFTVSVVAILMYPLSAAACLTAGLFCYLFRLFWLTRNKA